MTAADFTELFGTEAAGHLAQLRRLCHEPVTGWHAAFVAAHTLKGSAAMLDLRGIRDVAAHLERLLSGDAPAGPPAWLADARDACACLEAELLDLRPGAAPSAPAEQVTARLARHPGGTRA
ncbi:Hpt domain-containing protein [Deinococcus sp. RM]|uniref:Hpt domain-containing protein n=1 Tax=Deinococcus sp. RM TaxID=2316359 RepID=UPI0013148B55|nr:Hpt domain-containing protein [Deinococcus sp. RM]